MRRLLVVVASVLIVNGRISAQAPSPVDRAGVESFNRAFEESTRRFDGLRKMSLVLHRGTDGVWRLRQEMWNQAEPADSLMVR